MIRYWLRGKASERPGWVYVLEAARLWSTPPWEIENEANALWWDRWRTWEEETGAYRREQAEKQAERRTEQRRGLSGAGD